MLFGDEVFLPNDRWHIGVLNGIITQPYLTIEGKGENIVLAPNFVHLLNGDERELGRVYIAG